MNKTFSRLMTITLVFFISACSMGAPAPTATLTATNTPVPPTATATATRSPTLTPRPTRTPNLSATQKVEGFLVSLQEYYDLGYISTMDGTYKSLGNLEVESPEFAGYYQWMIFDSKPLNFILQASVLIDTQSRNGGCGFVFQLFYYGENSRSNKHRIVYLGKDQYANYFFSRGLPSGFDHHYLESVQPSESTEIPLTLIVYGNKMNFIVQDQLGLSENFELINNASIGLVAISGSMDTNTRCQFKNIILWTLPE